MDTIDLVLKRARSIRVALTRLKLLDLITEAVASEEAVAETVATVEIMVDLVVQLVAQDITRLKRSSHLTASTRS